LAVAIRADYTNIAAGFIANLAGVYSGRANLTVWNIGNGILLTNRPGLSLSWAVAGDYPVTLTAYNDTWPGGVSATVMVHVVSQPVHYVSLNSTNPMPPFLSWDTAATNIQDAVDPAFPGAAVLVSNGVYRLGGRVGYGFLTNRLVVSKSITVQSVNGPVGTIIQGNGPTGDSASRCVFLEDNTKLVGFTLAAGATRNSGDTLLERSGGGVWCRSTNCLVLNCLITSNSASANGGGAFGSLLSNCTLTRNSATSSGGGAFGGLLSNCTLTTNAAYLGGAACSNTLVSCLVASNTASYSGGAAYGSVLLGCTIVSNADSGIDSCIATTCAISNNNGAGLGGGAYNSSLTNCLVFNNTAPYGAGAYLSVLTSCKVSGNQGSRAAGGYACTFVNSLIASNSAPLYPAGNQSTFNNCTIIGHTIGQALASCSAINSIVYYNAQNYAASFLTNCCTTPLSAGPGNFTNAPGFVDLLGGNLRLGSNSPCINAGNNTYTPAGLDLDGNLRIVGGTVDLGPYEFQTPTSVISYAWLQQYGLPTDGSADFVDSDRDGMNNWQEWVCGTDPISSASVLEMLSPAGTTSGMAVTWQSVAYRSYFVQRSTNLFAPVLFQMLVTNIPGQPVTTSFIDTNAPGLGPFFYRVGVQH
jgi:hypothetical protein